MYDETQENPGLSGEETLSMNKSEMPEQLPPQKKRINWLVPVNLVMLAGMVVLYGLFFTTRTSSEQAAPPLAFQKTGPSELKVVFVNIDTLNEHYEFVKVMKKELEATGNKLMAELQSEQTAFEKEAADFQKQVAANSISEERAKIVYESLMQKQQMLAEKKERYAQQVADKELNMNLTLLDTVNNFLKRYNQIYHYDYILANRAAGGILLANDTLDITNHVLKALNDDYHARKK